MRIYWQYISGMVSLLSIAFAVSLSLTLSADHVLCSSRQLKNLGALPITRIHTTLNMLVPTYKGRTTDELVAFLEAMQAEGSVEKTATGNWKIVK